MLSPAEWVRRAVANRHIADGEFGSSFGLMTGLSQRTSMDGGKVALICIPFTDDIGSFWQVAPERAIRINLWRSHAADFAKVIDKLLEFGPRFVLVKFDLNRVAVCFWPVRDVGRFLHKADISGTDRLRYVLARRVACTRADQKCETPSMTSTTIAK